MVEDAIRLAAQSLENPVTKSLAVRCAAGTHKAIGTRLKEATTETGPPVLSGTRLLRAPYGCCIWRLDPSVIKI